MSFHYRWFSQDEELTDALGNRQSRAALDRQATPRTGYTRGEVVSMVFAVLVLGYGIVRFLIEFVRLPDAQLGYLAGGWLTMGQLLSLPLIAVGAALLVYARKTRRPQHRDWL